MRLRTLARCSDFVIATRSRGAADRTSGMMLRCMVKIFFYRFAGASTSEELFFRFATDRAYPKGAKTLNFPRIEAEARARHRHRNGHQKAARCKHRPTKTFFELSPFSLSILHHLTPSEFVRSTETRLLNAGSRELAIRRVRIERFSR